MSERETPKIRRRTVLQGTAVGTAAALGVSVTTAQDDEETQNGAILGEGPTIGLETVAEGLTAPLDLQIADEEADRRFIVDQTGQIYVHDENGLQDEPFLDIADRMVDINEEFDERGLLGLAFHPDFEENGQFFVRYSAPGEEPEHGAPGAEVPETIDHLARLSRFETADDDNESADPDSEEILLEVPEPQFNHNGGPVAFGPDDYLYVALGDGGSANDVDEGHVEDWYDENEGGNGQDTQQNLLGGILRLDVDDDGDDERAYGIPDDNPLVDADDHLPEYYAWGFRNPWGMSFENGELLVADVGQGLFETVNHVLAGGNYAWNVWEGTHCFDADSAQEPPEDCPDTVAEDVADPRGGEPLLGPVIEYPHTTNAGRYGEEYDKAGGIGIDENIGVSITGGRIYRGQAAEEIDGMYVFGDWSRDGESGGRIFLAQPPEELSEGDDGGDAEATVSTSTHPDLGDILVGPNGRTLYMFENDEQGAGESACSDDCAENWPPLTVEEEPTAGENVDAELTTFEREDGSMQVAANGWPLYYFANDEESGDANGQGVNDVWWVLDTSGSPVRETAGNGDGMAGNETDAGGNETDANGMDAGNETDANGNQTDADGMGADGEAQQYHPPDEVDLWPIQEAEVEVVGGNGGATGGNGVDDGNGMAENATEENGMGENATENATEENGMADGGEAGQGGVEPIAEDGQLNHFVYGFGRDADGEVYVLTTNTSTVQGEGFVSRIVPADGDDGTDEMNGTDENATDGNETDGMDENATDGMNETDE